MIFFAAAADLVKRDNIVRFFFAAGADFGSNDCSPHSRSGSGGLFYKPFLHVIYGKTAINYENFEIMSKFTVKIWP